MAIEVKICADLVKEAHRMGKESSRSTFEQIEYWARMGKIAEENPDLPFSFINQMHLAKAEMQDGEVSPYVFG